MTETDIISIADNAKIIVNGYAFTEREDGFISILNLYHPDCAMVVNKAGEGLISSVIDRNIAIPYIIIISYLQHF